MITEVICPVPALKFMPTIEMKWPKHVATSNTMRR